MQDDTNAYKVLQAISEAGNDWKSSGIKIRVAASIESDVYEEIDLADTLEGRCSDRHRGV